MNPIAACRRPQACGVSMSAAFMSAVLAVAHPHIAYGGVNIWTSHGPSGAYVDALIVNPAIPSTLYAGTFDAGVFKSTDNGLTWTATGLTSYQVGALVLDPGTPTTLYAGTGGGGVFTSKDAGNTWAAINAGLTDTAVLALALDHSRPSTLYAGTSSGVFKSTDGGDTWAATSLTSMEPDTRRVAALA